MAATSGSKRLRKGERFSTRSMKAASLAIGLFLGGALACPPEERAVNFTSALPFSNTPIIA